MIDMSVSHENQVHFGRQLIHRVINLPGVGPNDAAENNCAESDAGKIGIDQERVIAELKFVPVGSQICNSCTPFCSDRSCSVSATTSVRIALQVLRNPVERRETSAPARISFQRCSILFPERASIIFANGSCGRLTKNFGCPPNHSCETSFLSPRPSAIARSWNPITRP